MFDNKIAYFGHPGSYSHLAALAFTDEKKIIDPLLIPCTNVDEVLSHVFAGNCFGVIPYYNSTSGHVQDHSKKLKSHSDLIVKDIVLPIHHYLLKLPGIKDKELTEVYSHPQGIKQCQKFLVKNFPQLQIHSYSSTSSAAKDLSQGILSKHCCVIASSAAAKLYNLEVIQKNIEDKTGNATHFKVLYKPTIIAQKQNIS